MDVSDQPVSKKIGIANKETIVSKVIAAALEGPCGDELLAALLDADGIGATVLASAAEVSVDGSRLDVVVVYEEGGRPRALAIETKVKAEQGWGQLDRYLEAIKTDAFLAKVQGLRLRSGVEADLREAEIVSSKLLYLTVAEGGEVPREAKQRTYREWWELLPKEGRECDGDLVTALLLDILDYLGGELGPHAEFVSGVEAGTSLTEFSEEDWGSSDLEKQLSHEVFKTFLSEFDRLNQESGTAKFDWYWMGRGNWSREFAYYRDSWRNRCSAWGDAKEPGTLASLIWDIRPASLGSTKPTVRLRVRFQVDPYHKKVELEEHYGATGRAKAFRDIKDAFGAKIAELAGRKGGLGYRGWRSEHQVGFAEVRLDPSGTLKDAAEAIWEKSLELAPLIDEALDLLRVDGLVEGPRAADSSEDRRPAFEPWVPSDT